jgi:hypothetical protein
MTWMTWYSSLAKPSWTPSPSTIGLVWQILYPIILFPVSHPHFNAIDGSPVTMIPVAHMRPSMLIPGARYGVMG